MAISIRLWNSQDLRKTMLNKAKIDEQPEHTRQYVRIATRFLTQSGAFCVSPDSFKVASMSGVLLITCSIGGGHLVAQANITKKLVEMGHQVTVFDMAQHFYPAPKIHQWYWDIGIRYNWRFVHDLDKGNLFYENLYEHLYAKRLNRALSDIITSHDIQTIYDVQPIMTNLILRIFSQHRTRGEYHKILTDLPYPGNRAYLGSLKRIQHHDHISFFVHATDTVSIPDTQDFWGEYAQLTPQQVKKTFALPVHDFYFQPFHREKALAFEFPLTRYCEHSLSATEQGYTLIPGTEVTTLMLGSQGLNATFEYVKQFLAQAHNQNQRALFCVACAKNTKLYDTIFSYANKHNLPHAQVLPFPQISQDILACVMWQSDRYIIRPSGLSCLEQLALRQDPINTHKPLWIHSGVNQAKDIDNPTLLKGCYGHERANAQHMLACTPSKMVVPASIEFFPN